MVAKSRRPQAELRPEDRARCFDDEDEEEHDDANS